MGYRFKRKQGVAENVRRIADQQARNALEQLSRRGDDLHDGVHRARKCFKKIRGLLRIVRPALGDAYSRENAAFRDIGRELSALRDAQARIECFDALVEAFADELPPDAFAAFREPLETERDAAAQDHVHEAEVVTGAHAAVEEALDRLRELPVDSGGFDAIRGGLAKTYRRGRRAMARAYERGDDETFHEWRKRVKYLWYHVRLLQPAWKRPMKALRKELHALADLLGDDHDLVVLSQYLDTVAGEMDAQDVSALRALLDRRHDQLRTAAWPLGRRIYAEPPRRFVARIERYWDVWRRKKK